MQDSKPNNAKEVLELVSAAMNSLEAVANIDTSLLYVDEEWSGLPDPKEHISFLYHQLAGLAAHIRRKSHLKTDE